MTKDQHPMTILEKEAAYQIPTYSKWPIALEKGKGRFVWDSDGKKYLDFYGGHCVTILGHCHDGVSRAVQAQMDKLVFYSNLVHSPIRAETAELISNLSPEGMTKSFLCNSGTEANETALKLARKFTGKSKVVSTHAGFHGRTLGSLAVTSSEKYRAPYLSSLSKTLWVEHGNSQEFENLLEMEDDIAAFILEPIQSMSGIVMASQEYFESIRACCDKHNVCLIFDEVQTGVFRTGSFSISESIGVKPDLITMAKSLGNGIPVGACLVSDAISETIQSGDQGTTFGGGMIAMAAVKATLESIISDKLMDRAGEIFDRIKEGLKEDVKEIRGMGCLIGIDLGRPYKPVNEALLKAGVLLGGSSDPNSLRVMPPLNTTDGEIDLFISKFKEVHS